MERYTCQLLLAAFTVLFLVNVNAQNQDEENVLEESVVTATVRVTAGGAQDINFARSEMLGGRIPHPNTLTAEGLMSQFDLTLPNSDDCEQLFCVYGESMPAELVSKPNDSLLVGLGFASNIKEDSWQREAAHIVAVVDKSGSMSGRPLSLVRQSLLGLVKELGVEDKLSVVLYGDRSHVYISPTRASRANKHKLRDAIKNIASSGSTNMEEGLKVAYELAKEHQENSTGVTRLILFTDEQPNVGNTSADSFIGMAKAASAMKIGLTTVGVGIQFDAELATKISSTRGGNLYFIDGKDAAKELFSNEFDYMISELAHDLKFEVKPTAGYSVTGVYGVPANMLVRGKDNSIHFTIPTVFLSNRGGGVFVSLAPSEQMQNLPEPSIDNKTPVLNAKIAYVSAKTGLSQSNQSLVGPPVKDGPSAPMQLANVLLDEFLSLRAATTAHHINNNDEGAYKTMRAFQLKLDRLENAALLNKVADETRLINQLTEKFAFLSGHSSEVNASRQSRLWGLWRTTKVKADSAPFDLKLGDFLAISPTNEVLIIEESTNMELDWTYAENFILTRNKLIFPELDSFMKYRLKGKKLSLRSSRKSEFGAAKLKLEFIRPLSSQENLGTRAEQDLK